MAGIDLLLTFIFLIGLIQLTWFAVMLHLRGVGPATISAVIPPLLTIWVLFWPLYAHPAAPLAGVSLLALLLLASDNLGTGWMRTLYSSWSVPPHGLLPIGLFTAGLAISCAWFAMTPMIGFGVALSLCLGLAAADMVDWLGRLITKQAPAAGRAWPGHVAFIIVTTLACAWAMQVYTRTGLAGFLGTTALAAMVATVMRILAPRIWQPPLIALVLGGMLCIL